MEWSTVVRPSNVRSLEYLLFNLSSRNHRIEIEINKKLEGSLIESNSKNIIDFQNKSLC